MRTTAVSDIAENLQTWADILSDKIEQHPEGLALPPDFVHDLTDALTEHARTLRDFAKKA